MKTLNKILSLLAPPERKRARVLMIMILIMAILDMLGVASILPFIAVLGNPDLVQDNVILNTLFTASKYMGIRNVEQFFFVLGAAVFLLLITSITFKALTAYFQTRFVLMCEFRIGKRLMEGYLNKPYSWFLNRHSADLGTTILSEVETAISGGLTPLINLIAHSAVALALLALLLVVDPVLAFSVGATLVLAYSCIFAVTSGWIKRIGRERFLANKGRFNVVNEAFGAVKEVKIGGLEQIYAQRFSKPAKIFAQGQAASQVTSQVPRFALEAVAFGGMVLVIMYLMAKSGKFVDVIPIIALYAYAGYRLLPALQQIYGALSVLRFASAGVDALYVELNSLGNVDDERAQHRQLSPLPFSHTIKLDHISYRYPNAEKNVLKYVDLCIPAHSKIGFIGPTGSGKTTTVDLILGLIEPLDGHLKVDGQSITAANRRQWQRNIGYVPQHIYLADDSVAANIAFGVKPEDIDQQAVELAAGIANMHDFVCNELPQGYATTVGERGVRLSGGQRQRIGIARALYHKPKVLVLDEATSALDNRTELAVMEAVNNLGREITVILIAHRLSTLQQCDKIYLLERGEIKGSGTYAELSSSSHQFADMAGNS